MEGDGVEVANSKHLQYSRGEVPPRERARYPSGKGEVCKTFMRRFDSDPRLHLFSKLQKAVLARFLYGREICSDLPSNSAISLPVELFKAFIAGRA